MEFLPLTVNNEKVYAGFWHRVGANLIDSLLLFALMFLFFTFQSIAIPVAIAVTLLFTLVSQAYIIYFHYRYGATLGKMALGIKVALPNGHKIGLKEAFLRSSVWIGIGLLGFVAQAIAISKSDPERYLSSALFARLEYMVTLMPTWYGRVEIFHNAWIIIGLIILVSHKQSRTHHDFLAGTVVIKKAFEDYQCPPPLSAHGYKSSE